MPNEFANGYALNPEECIPVAGPNPDPCTEEKITSVEASCDIIRDPSGRFFRCVNLLFKKCRRQVKNVTNWLKNVRFAEFHDHIWNQHEKYIEISTNIPSIGSLISEIAVTISEM